MNEDKSKAAKVRGIKKALERDANCVVQTFMLVLMRAPCPSVLGVLRGPIFLCLENARGQYLYVSPAETTRLSVLLLQEETLPRDGRMTK